MALGFDRLNFFVPDRVDDVLAVEEPLALLRREAVLHVGVVEDLGEAAATAVLADHVGRDPVLGLVHAGAASVTRRAQTPTPRAALINGPWRQVEARRQPWSP